MVKVGLRQTGRFDIKDLIYNGNKEHNRNPGERFRGE